MPESVANILLRITGDTGDAERDLRTLSRRLAALDRQDVDVDVDVDDAGATARLSALSARLKALDAQDVDVDIDVDRRGRLTRFALILGSIGRAIPHVIGNLLGLNRATQAVESSMGGAAAGLTGGAAALARFTVLLGVIAPLVAVVISLAAALAAMVASLAAAVTALGAIAVALGGAAVAAGAFLAGVVLIAKQGGPQIEGIKRALGGLKTAFLDAVRPGARAFLSELAPAIRLITPGIRALRPAFTAFGTVAGRAVRTVAVGLRRLLPDFGALIRQSAGLSGPLARSLVALGEILLNIARAAMPFLIRGARAVAEQLERWAAGTRNIRGVRDVIGGLVGHLKSWWSLIRAIADVMLSFFKVAAGDGKSLVDSFAVGAQNLADWIKSAEGSEKIQRFFKDVLPLAKELITLLGRLVVLFLVLTQTVAPLMTPFLRAINLILGAIIKLLDMVRDVVDWFGKLSPVIKSVAAILFTLMTPIGMVIGTFGFARKEISAALGAIKSVVSGAAKFVSSAFSTLSSAVRSIWGRIAGFARNIWVGIRSTIADTVRAVTGFVRNTWNGARSTLASIWSRIRQIGRDVWVGIRSVIADTVRTATGFVRNAWIGARDTLSSIWSRIRGVARDVWIGIRSTIADTVRAAVGFVRDAWIGARGVLADIWNRVAGIARGAWNNVKSAIISPVRDAIGAIRGLAGSFFSAGAAIMRSLGNGLISAARGIVETVKGILSSIRDKLPFSEPKDPTSPLRHLKRSGAAIMENLAEGIPAGAVKLTRAVTAQLSAMPVVNVSPAISMGAAPRAMSTPRAGDSYTFQGPWSSGNGVPSDPREAVAAMSLIMRQRGGLR